MVKIKIKNPLKSFEKAAKKVFSYTPAGVIVGTIRASQKAQKAQKKAQREQSAALEGQRKILQQQQEEALAQRKHNIDQQREQMVGSGYRTNKTSTTGIRGSLG